MAASASRAKKSAAPAVSRGSLLGIEHLPVAEITKLLALARRMNPNKPRPLLRGKRVATALLRGLYPYPQLV